MTGCQGNLVRWCQKSILCRSLPYNVAIMCMLVQTIQRKYILPTVLDISPIVKRLATTVSHAPDQLSYSYQTTWMPFSVTFVLFITTAVYATKTKKVLQSNTPTEPRRQSEPLTSCQPWLKEATNHIQMVHNGFMIPPAGMTIKEEWAIKTDGSNSTSDF